MILASLFLRFMVTIKTEKEELKLKKVIIGSLASVLLFTVPTQTFAASKTANVQADRIESHEVNTDIRVNENDLDLEADNFGLPTDILNEARNTPDLTSEEKTLFNKELNYLEKETLITTYGITGTIASVMGIITAGIALTSGGHSLGEYAARQAEVRLGLTASSYKEHRWAYRSAITVGFGWAVALGFDDYFYGV